MNQFEKLKVFVAESYHELRKVTWPSRKELQSSSLVVVVVSLLCMLVIWLLDTVIYKSISFFFRM